MPNVSISIEENDRRQLQHAQATSRTISTGDFPRAIANPANEAYPFIVNNETEEQALYESARYVQAVAQAKAASAVKVEPSEVAVTRLQEQLAQLQARFAELTAAKTEDKPERKKAA